MRRIFRRIVRTETTITWTVTYNDEALTPEPRPNPSSGRLAPPVPSGPEAKPADWVQAPDQGNDAGTPDNAGVRTAAEGNQEIDQ